MITGPLLSDLAVSVIAILFLYELYVKKNFKYLKNNIIFFFLIFNLYLLINSVFKNPGEDSLKIFFYWRFIIFAFAISYLIQKDKKVIRYFYYVLLLSFSLLCFDGFIQYFFKKNIIGLDLPHGPRVSSFFGDELILGSYLSRLFPILFGISILLKKKKSFKLPVILIFILSECIVFLSGERTSFFYMNLSCLFMIFMLQENAKLRMIILSFSLILILIVSIFNDDAKQRIIDQTLKDFNISNNESKVINNNQNQDIYFFTKQHDSHFRTALKMFLGNQMFGVGVKNFRNQCNLEIYKENEISCSTHPHNTYIQAFSELGFFGGIFYIFIFLIFIKSCFKHVYYKFFYLRKKIIFDDFEICLLSSILITLWPLAPTGNIFNNWLNIIFFLPLAFLIWKRKREKTSPLKIFK